MKKHQVFQRLCLFALVCTFASCLEQDANLSSEELASSVPGCDSNGKSDEHNPNCQPQEEPDSGFDYSNPVLVPFGLGFVMTPTMSIQNDGKILYSGGTGENGGLSSRLALTRYNSDGTLDTSFGVNGVATADYGTGSFIYGTAVQADGKIIAAGASYNNESILLRFNENGTLDNSFPAIVMSGGNNQGFYFPLIQSDGKIIASAQKTIYRFNTSGALDSNFGINGHVNHFVNALALQNDQKILGCDITFNWGSATWSGPFTTVTRFNSDGSLDTSFGNSGTTPPPLFGANPCNAIAVQNDGKILIGGNFWYANSGDPNTMDRTLIYVVRFNTNGSVDASFATGGAFIHSMPKMTNDGVTALVPLPNGNIFVAGSGGTVELTSNGALVPTYISPVLADSQNGTAAAALSPSGDIIMNWIWSNQGYIYKIRP